MGHKKFLTTTMFPLMSDFLPSNVCAAFCKQAGEAGGRAGGLGGLGQ